MEDHNNILESNGDEEIGSNKKDYQNLESAKGEMGEVREENERLKFLLARLVKDYQSLQTNFFDILQQEEGEATKSTTIHEESELVVSLSLGISSSIGKPTMDEKENNSINNKTEKREDDHDIEDFNKGLALGLDIKFDPSSSQAEVTKNPSPQNSFDKEEGKEEEPSEMWPPSKVLKTMKSEASQHTQLKKARVSIRARCDTQTMNDGCQWRKYGQKIAKGNPCPRAYYRCTVSPSCPVRKQVQRCADDMSILITTYEGTHNHPLPVSATAMASTTSAAASMLQSPSLSSSQQAGVLVANSSDLAPIINSSAANYNPNALNLSTYQISRPHQFYFPNSSISTLNSHPTITLDLTAPPTSSGLSYIPKYSSSSRNLNFSSSGFSPLQSSMPQSQYWSSYSGGYFNNGSTLNQNRNQLGGYVINSTGKQPFHQPIYMSKSNHTNISQQQSLPDSIIAATKAITTNQKFQSALATALTTGSSSRVRENVKLSGGDVSYTWSQNGMYLNNGQQGNKIIIPPPLAVSKSGSGMSPNRIK